MSRNAGTSKTLQTIHADWTKERDEAITQACKDFVHFLPLWFQEANDDSGGEDSRAELSIGVAIAVAACAGADHLAAAGYFMLANRLSPTGEPNPAARLWYQRCLDHALVAEDDFHAAAAEYCLGAIDQAGGRADEAEMHLQAAFDYAEKAGDAGGQAAALYRRFLLQATRRELKAASDLALESYRISMEAKQLLPATETITALIRFYHEMGFDDLGETPAVTQLSWGIHQLSQGDQSLGRAIIASCLQTIAVLGPVSRERIVEEIAKKSGSEVEQVIRDLLEQAISMDEGGD